MSFNDPTPAEDWSHYAIRQLLLVESLAQPDAAFGASARSILRALRSRFENEIAAIEAAAVRQAIEHAPTQPALPPKPDVDPKT